MTTALIQTGAVIGFVLAMIFVAWGNVEHANAVSELPGLRRQLDEIERREAQEVYRPMPADVVEAPPEPGLVTYGAAAQWLPFHITNEIERTRP